MEAILQSPLGQTILEHGVVTIGSTPDSQLVVHDARVSPHHAILRPTEQGYTITDWHSAEGTFVNEQRLEPLVPRLLTAGDHIRLGETAFTYEVREGTALVPTQVSRPEDEPAAQVEPSEHMTSGADAQAISAQSAQTGYGSVSQKGYAPASQQQPGVPPGAPGAMATSRAAPPPPPPPLQKKPPSNGRLWKKPRRWKLIALIAFIVLLVGGSAPFLIFWLTTVLPATGATVTVTPVRQHLSKNYTMYAVTGAPDVAQNQTQARVLSVTTKAQSKTVKATGTGHQDAAQAEGKVTISPISGTVPVGNLQIPGNSGVNVIVDVTKSISSGSQAFDAYAVKTGSGGNIPAYDIDSSYQLVVNANVKFYAQNTQAFTGGQDAHDYTFVEQSDIDGAATPLVDQLTSDAQTAVQQQVQANEQFASTPECTPNIKANHKANDRVTAVTVTVTVTCKGEVYNAQAAQPLASGLLKGDAASQLGAHYALIGDMVIGTPQAVTTDEHGTVTLNVSAEGTWVYQFSDAQKHSFAQLIAGKSLADAQTLLRKQEGINKVSISTTGGWGHALPTSVNDIKFTIVAAPGSQATPAATPAATLTTTPTAPPTPASGKNTIGKAVQVGNTWVVTVNNVKTSPGDDVTKPKSGNIFIIVDVTVKNISSSSETVSSLLMFNLQNATGQQYAEVFTGFTNPPDATVTPNSVLQGQLVYEVPSTDHTFTFAFQSDSGGSDITKWNVTV